MKRLRPLTSALLALSLLAVFTSPASAAGSSADRRTQQEIRNRKAAAARKLDALKASDQELEEAVAALNAKVRAQAAAVSSARQASSAADAAAAQAAAQLEATTARIGSLRTLVVDRAVTSYMRPQQTQLSALTGARDLGEASRRSAMLAQVANSTGDTLDELRAAQEDQEIERERRAAAQQTAAKRRAAVESKLKELTKDRDDKARVEAALDQRIKAFQSEVDVLAAEEAKVAELIRSREARARASRSAGGTIDAGGRVSGAGLIWPVGGRVTSEYGQRWGRLHAGIDIAAPSGTPIRAAKAGEVIFAGSQGGYGNMILVDHGGGFVTAYPHQTRFAASEGDSVSQGQVIGYVGCTGSCTGPHLHFETRVGGSPQNPRRYLP